MTQTNDTIAQALRKTIGEHINDGNAVANPDQLIGRLLEALGHVDEFDYKGWHVRRVSGKELKCRGYARDCSGFIATHETGYVTTFPPSSSGDMPATTTKQMLDQLNEIYAITGSFTVSNKK